MESRQSINASDSNEFETLKLMYEDQRQELSYRRGREFQIFTWSSTILVALTAALLLTEVGKNLTLEQYGVWGDALITSIVISLVSFSVTWQHNQRRLSARHAKVLARITREIGCFDENFGKEGKPVYPEEWKAWGISNVSFRKHLSTPGKISATIVLGIITIVAIWLPSFLAAAE